MATLYILEATELKVFQGNNVPAVDQPPIASQTVAITGASVQSAALNSKTRIVRLHCDIACSIAVGANPTATTSTLRMPANSTEFFHLNGADPAGVKIAVIAN
jgi:hypothetical protein